MKCLQIVPLAILVAGLSAACPAQAAPVTYFAELDGGSVQPGSGEPGTGTVTVVLDTAANTLRVAVSFSGLSGPATSAHVHCCATPPGTAGVAVQVPSLTGFPNTASGSYDNVFDTASGSTWNPAFVNAHGGTYELAEAAFAAGLAAGRAYLDIHTATWAGGEIGGFLAPAPLRFFTVAPCRLVDTRQQLPDGTQGQPLFPSTPRTFPVAGACGMAASAAAIAVNVTAVQPNAPGHLSAYAAGDDDTGTSLLNFVVGSSRANNATVRLGVNGLAVVAVGATVHLVIDVVGYYEARPPT
jgi:hypothetical protein